MFVNLEINLKILEENEKFPNHTNRDAITHIFGTFDTKITFLGFKCRSGKTSFIGNPKGDPFLFGDVSKQLHYLRIEENNGIVSLRSFFIKTPRTNPFLSKNVNEIDDKFFKNDPPIYEEGLITKIKNPKEIEQFILHPFISDDFFFNKKFLDKIRGFAYTQICTRVKRFGANVKEFVKKKKN